MFVQSFILFLVSSMSIAASECVPVIGFGGLQRNIDGTELYRIQRMVAEIRGALGLFSEGYLLTHVRDQSQALWISRMLMKQSHGKNFTSVVLQKPEDLEKFRTMMLAKEFPAGSFFLVSSNHTSQSANSENQRWEQEWSQTLTDQMLGLVAPDANGKQYYGGAIFFAPDWSRSSTLFANGRRLFRRQVQGFRY